MRPSIFKSFNPDILVEMIEMAYRLENWDKMIQIADILYKCVQTLYGERQYRKAIKLPAIPSELRQPLVYYFGIIHHMRGIAFLEKGEYEQARACVDFYAELGWIEDLDEKGLEVVENYRFLAQANRYSVELLSGGADSLASYTAFLRENPEELLPGLNVILRAALKYGYDVDELIQSFPEQTAEFSTYEDEGNQAHYYHFSQQLTLYKARSGKISEALGQVIDLVKLAHQTGKECFLGESLALFEWLRDAASEDQLQVVRAIVQEAWHDKSSGNGWT